MKLFLTNLFFVILIGILFNTIVKFAQHMRISFAKIKNFESPNTDSFFNGSLDEKLEGYIYLDTFNKWKIWIYIMSFTLLPLFKIYNFNFIIQVIVVTICILAVGDFLHSAHRLTSNDNLAFMIMFYVINLMILVNYILHFNLAFLKTEYSVELLLITTTISIFYSFLFIKYVVDVFSSYFIQFMHFIVVLLFFNFIVIGFDYGLFYWANNDIFDYYQSNEVQKISENLFGDNGSFKWGYIAIIVYKGIEPFFNFPQQISEERGLLSFIPLIEHFIGNIFNLLIIGFFVSYSVTNLFELRNKQLGK